jgi:hypothetical protein
MQVWVLQPDIKTSTKVKHSSTNRTLLLFIRNPFQPNRPKTQLSQSHTADSHFHTQRDFAIQSNYRCYPPLLNKGQPSYSNHQLRSSCQARFNCTCWTHNFAYSFQTRSKQISQFIDQSIHWPISLIPEQVLILTKRQKGFNQIQQKQLRQLVWFLLILDYGCVSFRYIYSRNWIVYTDSTESYKDSSPILRSIYAYWTTNSRHTVKRLLL